MVVSDSEEASDCWTNYAEGNECASTDGIDRTLSHGLEHLDCVLQSSTCASDAECESGAAASVSVITLAQQLYDPWHLAWILEQQECE